MDPDAGQRAFPVAQALAANGPNFEFAQFVRLLWLHAASKARDARRDVPELTDIVRFRAHPSLSFPASSIQDVQKIEALDDPEGASRTVRSRPEVTVNFLGLIGPAGVLPHHYTQFVYERVRRKDFAGRDFFDIFNDLFVRLFFLAREKHRPHFQWERDSARGDVLSMLRSVIGLRTPGLEDRFRQPPADLPDDAMAQFAGLLGRRPVAATALARVLGLLLRLPVQVHGFFRQWLTLQPEHRAQLGKFELGGAAAIGGRALDYQSAYLIEVGPVSSEDLDALLPGQRLHGRVAEIARFAAGVAMEASLRVRVAPGQSPRLQLIIGEGKGLQLGFNTWLNGNSRFWSSNKPEDLPEAVTTFKAICWPHPGFRRYWPISRKPNLMRSSWGGSIRGW